MIYEIGIAFLINCVVGALWYSPLMFGKTFMETAKLKAQDLKMGKSHIIGIVLFGLMEVFGLYYLLDLIKCTSVFKAAKYAYLCWQFFICPTSAIHYVFDQRPLKELLSKWGHHLVTFVLEAVGMQLFRQWHQ